MITSACQLCNLKKHGALVRNPRNCAEFFMCRPGGRPVRFSCPTGMSFDTARNSCGFGWSVCNDSGWTGVEDPVGQYDPIATNPSLLDPLSGVCNGAPTGSLRPWRTGCSGFYQCSTVGSIQFECPVGTLFDSNRLYCEAADLASCDVEPERVPGPAGNLLDVMCFGKRVGVKYAHPLNCSQYFQCDGRNKALLFNCPRGTAYDKVRRVCGFTNTVVC
ncbi:peritrophin-1-like [Anopheles bellator]|uniref:peritrophin-1-like n=1 Tax=Anopheles bellator TaxID=139047 RepID=UPI002649F19A|nr:peritrophin-1-like [Anopheles bellator]